jgi:3-oxoacyl-[acyl-carrier-protein] synthase-3
MQIESIGFYVPEGRITNREITRMVREFNEERLSAQDLEFLEYGSQRKFEFLGLDTRSACKEGDNFCTMAEKAAGQALKKAGLLAADIDCLIFSGVTNPYREPSFSNILAHRLGMVHGDFFDVNDTCNGFIKSLEIAQLYLDRGLYDKVLVACAESPLELMDALKLQIVLDDPDQMDTRLAGLLVGAGAAAMVLSREGKARTVVHYHNQRTSRDWDASMLALPGTPVPGSKFGDTLEGFRSDARLIASQLIKHMPGYIIETLSSWDMTADDIDWLIFHQLGDNITFAILDKLKADHAKAPINTFRELGNMATVNIPVNLGMLEQQKVVKDGDSVLLISSSCGLSYALVHIVW